jgi:hypothetical protein
MQLIRIRAPSAAHIHDPANDPTIINPLDATRIARQPAVLAVFIPKKTGGERISERRRRHASTVLVIRLSNPGLAEEAGVARSFSDSQEDRMNMHKKARLTLESADAGGTRPMQSC